MTQSDWKDYLEEVLIDNYREELFNKSLGEVLLECDLKKIDYRRILVDTKN